MRVSVWHRTELKQPPKSGYYFSYRGWGIAGKADGDEDYGYLYYHSETTAWYEYEGDLRSMHPRTCIVYYWTDATPDEWTDQDPPSIQLRKVKEEHNVALEDAWKKVCEAIDQYNMIKELVK
jgi:hypothetical protein